MAALFTRYRERLQHQHAWEVELECPACGTSGVPMFNGWTPSYAINVGNTPTIYANLTCGKCGANLSRAAGKKLVELLAGVSIPSKNKRVMACFLVIVVVVPLVMAAGVFAGIWAGWWGYQGFVMLSFLSALYLPSIMWLNWQVASIRFQCECGYPTYKFMGLLGRSYCYRCSTCGRLLRLRD